MYPEAMHISKTSDYNHIILPKLQPFEKKLK